MPLGEYLEETMRLLGEQPEAEQNCVQRVYPLRYTASEGEPKYQAFYQRFNDAMSAAQH